MIIVTVSLLLMLGGGVKEQKCASLEMADTLRLLGNANVIHHILAPTPLGADRVMNHFGSTNYPEIPNRAIRTQVLINDYYVEPIRRLSIIHELFHLRHAEEKMSQNEEVIQGCAIRRYKEIFGGDFDLPPMMREFPPKEEQSVPQQP